MLTHQKGINSLVEQYLSPSFCSNSLSEFHLFKARLSFHLIGYIILQYKIIIHPVCIYIVDIASNTVSSISHITNILPYQKGLVYLHNNIIANNGYKL